MRTYVRKYVFIPRYRPEQALTLRTADGLRLAGAGVEGPADAFATVVLVHGFAHSSRTPGIHAFAHLLGRRVNVVVPDLRGHGKSEGWSTLGAKEPLDVDAAVASAKASWPDLPVLTAGISMGGASVLLHAGTFGGVAGVVAISSPAWWGDWDTAATQRVRRFAMSRWGRFVTSCFMRTRITANCEGVPDARDVVASIAPAFTLIVADPADHYFGRQHPETLMAWAKEPKALWMLDGTGHGTDLLTPDFAVRLLDDLHQRLAVQGAEGAEGVAGKPLPN